MNNRSVFLPTPLVAMGSTCPTASEVISALEPLGFRLDFALQAMGVPSYEVGALPAQYHLLDRHRTEVIYLAGPDHGEERERLPVHASRWWIYPGRDRHAVQQVAQFLAARWSLSWEPPREER